MLKVGTNYLGIGALVTALGKNQYIRLSVGLNHASVMPEFVALSDGNENDMIQGRKFEFPKGSIVAFDKGYVDYQWFGHLTNQGVSFVTRLRPKAVYAVLKRKQVNRSQGVLSDQVIQLNSAHALKRGASTSWLPR